MADNEILKTEVTLDANDYVRGAKAVSKSAKEMGESAEESADKINRSEGALAKFGSALKRLGRKQKIDIDTRSVNEKVGALESKLEKMTGKRYNITAEPKVDRRQIKEAKSEARQLQRELQELTGKKYSVNVDMGGNASGGLKGLLAGSAIGSGVAAAGAAVAAGAVTGATKIAQLGSSREQNMVAMTHFMDGDKKGAAKMLGWASNNARKTQYSEADVQGTTRRAVQIAGGDINKTKRLVMLAEDMASLNPSKSLEDAIEALADADMGEMERLKEFGFKSSKEEYDAAGGDMFKLKSNRGQTLEELYKGGTQEGAQTAAAKVGTALGTVESAFANIGEQLLTKASPALDWLVSATEQAAPVIEDTFMKIADTGGALFNALQPFAPILSLVGSIVGGVVTTAFTVVGEVVNGVVIPCFEFIGSKARPAMEGVTNAAKGVKAWFDRVREAVKGAVSALNGLPSKISSMASNAWSSLKSMVGGGGGREKRHATGTFNYSGGLSRINEGGKGELVQLPRGTRIYPYATTQKEIKKLVGNIGGRKISNVFNVNIDARGSNMTKEQTYRLKREIVNDIVEAFDNSVPA